MTPESSEEHEALKPQSRKPKRKKKRKWLRSGNLKNELTLIIEEIEEYCIDCVEWSEVRPIVKMLEIIVPRDGPQELWKAVKRIKQHFKDQIYGPKIIRQGDTINGDKNEIRRGGKVEKFYTDDIEELINILLNNKKEKKKWQRLTE